MILFSTALIIGKIIIVIIYRCIGTAVSNATCLLFDDDLSPAGPQMFPLCSFVPVTDDQLRRVKDWVQLFCARCLNYPWGGRYHTINRKAVVSM